MNLTGETIITTVLLQQRGNYIMKSANDNSNFETKRKIHNPKAHAPAVYIPCWLIQIPIKKLSHAAKMLYGRLSQWCDKTGNCYRSAKELAQELGCSERSIVDYLKELTDEGLIGTYLPQAGGVNHFEFYDHPWMHEPINENLVYKSNKDDPQQNPAEPSAESCGTPQQNPADININKTKEIKSTSLCEKNKNFGLEEILNDNPFELPQETIEDWLTNRKKKKLPITRTAWNKTNKELAKCQKENIDPIEAFETLVASGWQCLKVEYLLNIKKTDTKPKRLTIEEIMGA